MINKLLKRLGFVLPFFAVVCGLGLLLADPLPLQSLRNHLFDQYQRWHPRDYQPLPVRVIDIDEESLTRLGQWPWPRTRLAELVTRLNAAGVAAIGFDVVFAEADRTSPQAAAELWQLQGMLRSELEKLPDHDAAFARSMAAAPVILGFALERGQAAKSGQDPASTAAPRLPLMPFRYINAGESPDRWLHPFATTITSLPIFEQAAQGNGALSFVPDGDGVVRRVPLVLKVADQPVSTLVAETLRVGAGREKHHPQVRRGKGCRTGGNPHRRVQGTDHCQWRNVGALLAAGTRALSPGLEGLCRRGAGRTAGRPSGAGRRFGAGPDGPALQSARPHHAGGRSACPGARADPLRALPAAPGLGDRCRSGRHRHRRPADRFPGAAHRGPVRRHRRRRPDGRCCSAAAGMPFASTTCCSIP